MDQGIIPIDKQYELTYVYYDRDPRYRYFNRKFEIFLLKKTKGEKEYVLHLDNCDTTSGKWVPHLHRLPDVNKKLYFGMSMPNWHTLKQNLMQCILDEVGEEQMTAVRTALGKLASPKL